MESLRIDIWSDIACPWCYVGKRRLEQALMAFPHADAVTVRWRSFELDPAAPATLPREPYAARLARKYAMSREQAQGRIDHLVALAREDGLALDFERITPGNTFNAHRLLHAAHESGLGDALKERLFRGYLCEGAAIGETEALLRLALDAGLDEAQVSAVLNSNTYADAVRSDQAEARRLGVNGVPFFVIGRYGVSGAQPATVLGKALVQAWQELAPIQFSEGASCGPDGC